MRVFVTGATGFIGTAVVQDLIKAGHTVLGLTRSDTGPRCLLPPGPRCTEVILKTWTACATARLQAR